MNNLKHDTIVLIGGWCMVVFSILFIGITIAIDNMLQTQPMLYSMEQHNLFKVAAGSTAIRMLFVLYAITPLLLIPGAVSTYYAFIEKYEVNMRIALYFAMIGTIALMLSMLMLPTLNWHLVSHIQVMPSAEQSAMIILLQSFHNYFGILIGDIMGFGCILVWMFTFSIITLRSDSMPHVLGVILLIIATFAAFIFMLRTTTLLPPISTHVQLPGIIALWIFICGIGLISLRKETV